MYCLIRMVKEKELDILDPDHLIVTEPSGNIKMWSSRSAADRHREKLHFVTQILEIPII